MHLSGSTRYITPAVLCLALASLWMFRHGYAGLDGDAQIYAFQALARLHPYLSADLYLQNVTQDEFTVFSPLYAAAIDVLGLGVAARMLTLALVAAFMAAAWRIAARLSGEKIAWWGLACLVYSSAIYGGAAVFRFSENYLTARLPAEALAAFALASHLSGRRVLASALALAAMLFHPLMGLPVLLILVLLWLPPRLRPVLVAAGVLACVAFAAVSSFRMDAEWLEIVRERSEFLFLQLWSLPDWNTNGRLLLFLLLALVVIDDARVRRIGIACVGLGCAGLIVAATAGLIGPSALLVQGQAWRWVWPAGLLSCLLLPAVIAAMWRHEYGRPAAALMLWGWLLPDLFGTVLVIGALFLWSLRKQLTTLSESASRWSVLLISTAALAWLIHSSWAAAAKAWAAEGAVAASAGAAGLAAIGLSKARSINVVQVFAAAATAAVLWISLSDSDVRARAAAACLIIVAAVALSRLTLTGKQVEVAGTESPSFADWRQRIPPSSTVFVAPARDVGAFVWFTLGRPNYLSLNQSAGVVFSRATSLEIKRRSEIVRPLIDPTWRVLSNHGRDAAARRAAIRPLTDQRLAQVCRDPTLDFVIAPEALPVAHIRHPEDGAFKNWNLYDCAATRPPPS